MNRSNDSARRGSEDESFDEGIRPVESSTRTLDVPRPRSLDTDEAGGAVSKHYVVGIGASAGGLDAIERFFTRMPETTGMSFVLIQHLSPDFKSLMDELLAHHTRIPIHRVENGMVLERDAIYLIPPKKNMVLSGGRLYLNDMDQKSGLHMPIDVFFRSLAQDVGDRAIGVILSGTGTDGSRGIHEINERGGLIIVQDIESANFDGMPRSAIATGLVDLTLLPEQMPERILQYVRDPDELLQRPEDRGDDLDVLFALLDRRFGIDFRLYKPGTIARRLERRISMSRVSGIEEYLDLLEAHPDELDLLYRDLLVEVTRFFRDGEAFELARQLIVPEMFANLDGSEGIRIWVPGCATGEEAYSWAILLHEYATSHKLPLDVRIFATDAHRESLAAAGTGLYIRESVEELGESYLERYFIRKQDKFLISQDIRQLVLFAPHNLTKDPPFTKLDLISCRNVLIYLNPNTQRKILSLFHFGLRTGGSLMLGPSENLMELDSEFEPLHATWKLFRKRRMVRLASSLNVPSHRPLSDTTLLIKQRLMGQDRPGSVIPAVYEALLDRFVPDSLLVDDQHRLIHVFGQAAQYLGVPEGRITVEVTRMVDEGLRVAVGSALHRAAREGEPVAFGGVRACTKDDRERILRIEVTPLAHRGTRAMLYLISILEEEGPPQQIEGQAIDQFDFRDEAGQRIRQLERELTSTRETLNTTIEELETSNEELQSANEELLASNEELQSTNEELHSVNEELFTVNAEHQRKIEELTELTNDIDNLLRSTDIGTVFLDRDLRVRKFTPSIEAIYNLLPQDVGRPISHIACAADLSVKVLTEMLSRVTRSGEPAEREVHTHEGRTHLLRILPYCSSTGEVEGSVLTFVDITTSKRVERELALNERRLSLANEVGGICSWEWDRRTDRIVADPQFFRFFGLDPQRFAGTAEALLECLAEADRPILRQALERVWEKGHRLRASFQIDRPDDPRHIRVLGDRIRADNQGFDDEHDRLLVVCIDETERYRAELDRQALHDRDRFLTVLSHELRNPLGATANAVALLEEALDEPEERARALDVIKRQTDLMARMIDDLLEVSRIARKLLSFSEDVVLLDQVLHEVVEAGRVRAQAVGITLQTELPDQPLYLLGDPARVHQLFTNLISNAIKFTPRGGRINVRFERRENWAEIRVEDNGVGLDPQMLDRIFEPFVQVSETQHLAGNGIGVGLTLAHAIVQHHGGRITAESDGFGHGARFRVALPIQDDIPRSTEDKPEPTGSVVPLRIVLIEDNDDSRVILGELLRREGYRVELAPDGETGAELIEQIEPDTAIIDIHLPGIDGYEVARRIRKQFSSDQIQLLALTGYGRGEDRRQILAAGFDEHLVKPLRREVLDRILRSHRTSVSSQA